jgi:hypothetical protein
MTDDILANLNGHRRKEQCDCGAWTGTRHAKDCDKAKRARNNRARGGRWELEAARILERAFPDARKVGPLGGPDDIIAGPLYIQAKAVASLYPKRLDDLLADIEQHCRSDQYPALILKHPGHEKRHKLVVMDARDFANLLNEERGRATERITVALGPGQFDADEGERP